MARGPAFNIEAKFDGPEDARAFMFNELKPFLEDRFEKVIECDDVGDFGDRLEVVVKGANGNNLQIKYRETYDEHVGNLGNWPALVISYQSYGVAEMSHVKAYIEVLDEIRNFLIKRKPASDVKYYSGSCWT